MVISPVGSCPFNASSRVLASGERPTKKHSSALLVVARGVKNFFRSVMSGFLNPSAIMGTSPLDN